MGDFGPGQWGGDHRDMVGPDGVGCQFPCRTLV